MSGINNLFLVLLIGFAAYFFGRKKAVGLRDGVSDRNLHSLPSYYGYMAAMWSLIPALLLLAVWVFYEPTGITSLVVSELSEDLKQQEKASLSLTVNEISSLAASQNYSGTGSPAAVIQAAKSYNHYSSISAILRTIAVMSVAILGAFLAWRQISPAKKARNNVEKLIVYLMAACASIAIITTIGILFSVLFESIQFFRKVSITEFLFGLHWSPQTAIRVDQAGSSGAFGGVPLFWGTIFISLIALLVAVPLGLISAIYLSEYASRKVRSAAKPVLEVLAGVPTVVYGFFAALTIAPNIREFGDWLRGIGESFDIDFLASITVSSESALAAGLVMGIMIIPFVSSLSDDVISAVPDAMRDGSLAMGSTKSETIWKVLVPAALPGIVGGVLLAASRAIGETMIVVMAAGLAAKLTVNPLDAVTTVTVQIVTLLTGDQEFDSAKTLAAFALGLGLFIITLFLNVFALGIVRKYREQYE